MKELDIEIILCSVRPSETISAAINRLLEHRPRPKRIIVVLPEDHLGLNNIRDPERITVLRATRANLSIQRNIGLEFARAEVVGFIDDDTVLIPDHLGEVWQTFAESPDLVGVGGKVLNYGPAPVWLSTYRSLFLLSRPNAIGSVAQMRSGFFVWPDPRNAPIQVDALWGCCMWWRRTKIQGLWFNERLSAFEDVEFGLRARSRGPLLLSGTARFEHLRLPDGRSHTKQALQQLLEARKIAQVNPGTRFSHALWMWASLGQIALAVTSKLIRAPWMLTPEYREPHMEQAHADHN